MAEYTITVSEEVRTAGIALLGSAEAFERELQAGIDKMVSPWVAKYQADAAKEVIVKAAELKAKYDAIPAERQAEIDAILTTFGPAPNEEPLEP
jgi:hypothetical protein